jgi:putative endonuclease
MGRCMLASLTISCGGYQNTRPSLFPGFTRKYELDQLVYFEAFDSILEARAREHSLKRWRRTWKIALIEKLNPDWRDLKNELNF